MQKQKKLKILVECAVMIGLAAVLSYVFRMWQAPFGGSATLFSMVPIIIIGFRHGPVWGFGTAFVFSVMQLMIDAPQLSGWGVAGAKNMILCVFLDYIVAFTLLGLTGFFKYAIDKNQKRGKKIMLISAATLLVCILRYISHVVVGAVIWYAIARAGEGEYYVEFAHTAGAWVYSAVYNLQFMLPETIITLAAAPAVVTILSAVGKTRGNTLQEINTD